MINKHKGSNGVSSLSDGAPFSITRISSEFDGSTQSKEGCYGGV